MEGPIEAANAKELPMYFENRQHAGRMLAEKLKKYVAENPLLLALPRGGVPVAAEIAKHLNLPLEVLVVRKLASPYNSDLAVGALCEGGEPIFNDYLLSQLGLTPDDLNSTVKQETKEIDRQLKEFRQNKHLPTLAKRTVILVDDGLATGATMLSAIQCLNKKGCKKIIVAAPVALNLMAQSIRKKVDEVVTIEERSDLWSVGRSYEDYTPVADDEVKQLLLKFKPHQGDSVLEKQSNTRYL